VLGIAPGHRHFNGQNRASKPARGKRGETRAVPIQVLREARGKLQRGRTTLRHGGTKVVVGDSKKVNGLDASA